jgi:hypothetical protein
MGSSLASKKLDFGGNAETNDLAYYGTNYVRKVLCYKPSMLSFNEIREGRWWK